MKIARIFATCTMLAIVGCSNASSTAYFHSQPAMISNVSAPKTISLGRTAIITASVYAGPNWCHAVSYGDLSLDEGQKRIVVDTYSNFTTDAGGCNDTPVLSAVRMEFTPTATGTYLVEANRFIPDYYPGTPSATTTIEVTP
ncbi:hypothetical protein J7643_10895 [bacterium]|nr:hypothetical protein [bacterium]